MTSPTNSRSAYPPSATPPSERNTGTIKNTPSSIEKFPEIEPSFNSRPPNDGLKYPPSIEEKPKTAPVLPPISTETSFKLSTRPPNDGLNYPPGIGERPKTASGLPPSSTETSFVLPPREPEPIPNLYPRPIDQFGPSKVEFSLPNSKPSWTETDMDLLKIGCTPYPRLSELNRLPYQPPKSNPLKTFE